MYAALWRALPGGRLAKSLQSLGVFLVVVTILFVWVFPAVATRLPFENVTLEPAAGPRASAQPTAPAPTRGSPQP